ncbi:hypothetical protein HN784_03840 [bacterium]|mgnify:CR=1 FL=1|jgi:transcriptional regulator of heat shock response|nr:hypothetical protein [bacterium]MBT4251128.1 hypothetical protein [bacterium]MBT4598080.1 hypothetical protein [bacterium]MBT6753422.1 hypothetical protein [bacterium]MBT7038135.1 hypothetical protein [bacterium]
MLSDRQGKILALIVQEYTRSAVPVSSSSIMKAFRENISSATIRNEMFELERIGFLLKPHVSAGRTPSDAGYRYFIDNLLKNRKLTQDDQKTLQVEMLKLKAQNTRLSRTLAKTLSTTSRCMALSGMIEKKDYYDFGMHTLMDDPEFNELDEVSRIAASLDVIDEKMEKLLDHLEDGEIRIFIGEENPIEEIRKCSMIISPYRLENGERGVLAIIGPKRMEYGKNKNLIDFVSGFFSNKSTKAFFITATTANLVNLI